MGIAVGRRMVRGSLHHTKRIHKKLVDFGDLNEAILKACKRVITEGIGLHRDTHMRRLTPLAASTLERKRRQGLPLDPLVATGAMTDDKTFSIRTSKQKGHLRHKKPRGARGMDYGLVHQHSKRSELPRRQWWLEPGSKMWNIVQHIVIPEITHAYVTGRSNSPSALAAIGFAKIKKSGG